MNKEIYRVATSSAHWNNPAVIAVLREQDLVLTTSPAAALFLYGALRTTKVLCLPHTVSMDALRVSRLVDLLFAPLNPPAPESIKITTSEDLRKLAEDAPLSCEYEAATKAQLANIRTAINALERAVREEPERPRPAPVFADVAEPDRTRWLRAARSYGMHIAEANSGTPYQVCGEILGLPFHFHARYGTWEFRVVQPGRDPNAVSVYHEDGNDPHNGNPPDAFVMDVLLAQAVRFTERYEDRIIPQPGEEGYSAN